jgi:hypothetical protein
VPARHELFPTPRPKILVYAYFPDNGFHSKVVCFV